MKVSIAGAGYVGLTTGACLAYLGHEVTCVDSDPRKVEALNCGKSPIYEPHLDELIAQARDRLAFTTDYSRVAQSDVVFIAVGTPPGSDGAPDLRHVSSAVRSVGECLGSDFAVIVNKSTVPIGSGNWVRSILRESFESRHGSAAGRFAVASNPEFLREGCALGDTLYPDRIVIGADEPRALDVLRELYRPVLEQSFEAPPGVPRPVGLTSVPLVATGVPSAELIKYAANSFLALKISFINEIGTLADRVGADILQIALGIGLDQRIGPRFLQPGVGWGGSCFGKDTSALISTAAEYGLPMPIVKAAREVNFRQRDAVSEKLLSELRILKGRSIGILGLSFKPNTDDLRDSPAVDIALRLVSRGCRVRAHDPVAMERFAREYPDSGVQMSPGPESIAAGAEAVLVLTDWPQYLDLDWAGMARAMHSPVLLDARNCLDPQKMVQSGFRYLALSLPSPASVYPAPASV